jgi:hypothetical protein
MQDNILIYKNKFMFREKNENVDIPSWGFVYPRDKRPASGYNYGLGSSI